MEAMTWKASNYWMDMVFSVPMRGSHPQSAFNLALRIQTLDSPETGAIIRASDKPLITGVGGLPCPLLPYLVNRIGAMGPLRVARFSPPHGGSNSAPGVHPCCRWRRNRRSRRCTAGSRCRLPQEEVAPLSRYRGFLWVNFRTTPRPRRWPSRYTPPPGTRRFSAPRDPQGMRDGGHCLRAQVGTAASSLPPATGGRFPYHTVSTRPSRQANDSSDSSQ